MEKKHKHYFKSVIGLNYIDIYRIFKLYNVTDPCLQHAIKKLILAGERGAKDQFKDVSEAKDTIERWIDIWAEDKQRE